MLAVNRRTAPTLSLGGLLLVAGACSDEAQQQLHEAQREFGDVQKKLGEASQEMGDVTKELAKAAKVSKKDLERDVREIVRAAKEASKEVPRPSPAPSKPALKAEGRIRCDAGTCVVDRQLIEDIEQHPQMLLQEGLVVPISGPPAGLRLERLSQGGLGHQLGLRDGDVLTAVNDHAVTSIEDLLALPGHTEPREELELTFSRGKEPFQVKVRLSAPAPAPSRAD